MAFSSHRLPFNPPMH